MSDKEIIDLYKSGFSIDYIVNKYFKYMKRETKIINLEMRKIILINNYYTKKEAKEKVYKVIYNFVKKV